MLTFIDRITAAFLGALQAGGAALGTYSLGILSIVALIAYYREFGARLVAGGGQMSDAIGAPLLYFITVGGYYWGLVHLREIGVAALNTFIEWGVTGASSSFDVGLLQTPSFLFEIGLKTAKPIAAFDTLWTSVKSLVKLANSPGDLLAWWVIILAFLALTAHHMMLLIEYHVALMAAAVLLPWGLWSFTAPLAEFSLGWITGGVVRAFVGTAMLAVATPLFDLLNQPFDEIFTLPQTIVRVGGAVVFCLLCWIIPARAAGIAGRGVSLALSGSTLLAPAATFARFGLMASTLTRGASRLLSALQQGRGAAPAPGRP